MIGKRIKSIGEIVIRVSNMETMKTFYKEILGLELVRTSKDYVFFKIADGYGGHTQTIALFAQTNLTAFGEELGSIDRNHSSLHHVALEIDKNDYVEIVEILNTKHIEFTEDVFEWVKWKSIFIKDPEMNIIEFVCYDADI